MSKEIIVNAHKHQTRIAILHDRKLVELYIENEENSRTIGDIYLGRIRKVMPGIKACFVDIGQKQDAFLHFSDLSDNLPELLELVGETLPDPSESPNMVNMPLSLRVASLANDFELEAHHVKNKPRGSNTESSKSSSPKRRKSTTRRRKKPTDSSVAKTESDTTDKENNPSAKQQTTNQSSNPEDSANTKKPARRTSRTRSTKRGETKTSSTDVSSEEAPKPRRSRRPSTSTKTASSDVQGEEAPKPRRSRRPSTSTKTTSSEASKESSSNPRRSRSTRSKSTSEDAPKTTRSRKPRSTPRPPESDDKEISFAATSTQQNVFKNAKFIHPAQYLREGQRILVKISKEPISNKGSRVSTDISLAGRFLVLVPKTNYVAVSKKIASAKERRRLRALADSLLPDGFGVIVRTVAENKDAKSLDTDLNLLIDKWKKIEHKLNQSVNPPVALYQDVNLVSSVIRDLFTDDYDRVLIDHQRMYRNTKGYIQAVAPHMSAAVQLHESTKPIFEAVGIENKIQEAFSSRVNLPSGGYLFIEHTEAMHVIDVNSGRAGHGLSQEENSLNVNLEAAKYIAEQLRLRDLGGIIVVDFIDLRNDSNKRKVHRTLIDAFKLDRAVTKVLPMSDFGLVEITRQRLRPSVTIPEDGEIQPDAIAPENISISELLRRLENWIKVFKSKSGKKEVKLRVHPFVATHLRSRFPSFLVRWRFKYGIRIHLEPTEVIDPLQFNFLDIPSGDNITLQYDYY